MARPNKVMKSYRLPIELVERIENAADKMKIAQVDVIQEGVEMYLAKVEQRIKKAKGSDQ